jgi:hypothetical protein
MQDGWPESAHCSAVDLLSDKETKLQHSLMMKEATLLGIDVHSMLILLVIQENLISFSLLNVPNVIKIYLYILWPMLNLGGKYCK